MSLKIQLPAVQAQASEEIGGGVPRATRARGFGRLTRARHPDGTLGEAKLPRRADDSRRRTLLEEGGASGREDLDLGHVARRLCREDFGAARRHTALERAARAAGGGGRRRERCASAWILRVGWSVKVGVGVQGWGGARRRRYGTGGSLGGHRGSYVERAGAARKLPRWLRQRRPAVL